MLPDTIFLPLEFLRPVWLLGLIAIFLLSLFRYKNTKKIQSQGLIAAHLSKHLMTTKKRSPAHLVTFNLLAMIACIALAGPTWRQHELPIYEMQKAQVIALDLSYSMYASDAKPSRLSQAKYQTIDLIKHWSEGEKALVAYAGDAFTISPLTQDGNSIINHIPHLSPDIMPVSGERADLALERAINLLENAGFTRGHIVFISDGINPNTSKAMQKRLQGSNWMVSILAMASKKGAPITLPDGSLLKDQQGQIVISKLNKQPLYDITQSSGGLYLEFTNKKSDTEKLAAHFTANETLKKQSRQQTQNQLLIDDGYWLAFLLLPLFLVLFRKGLLYLALFGLTLQISSPNVEASIWQNQQQNAFQAFQQGDYVQASELYNSALDKGSALYKNKQYEKASMQFTQATIDMPNNENSFYNLGNSYAQLQDYDKAISAYQQALIINPELTIAQQNIDLLDELQKQQQNNEQNQKQQNSKQQQSNEQQQSSEQNQKQQNNEQQQNSEQNQKQQNNEQQQNSEQNQKQQSSEQQQSNEQNQKQQNSEQQQSMEQQDQQPAEQSEQGLAMDVSEQNAEFNQELQDLPNWLKNMPDDPSILLRNKMRLEYQKRSQSNSQQENNGVIW